LSEVGEHVHKKEAGGDGGPSSFYFGMQMLRLPPFGIVL
jgi:hypothetical protein